MESREVNSMEAFPGAVFCHFTRYSSCMKAYIPITDIVNDGMVHLIK
jgi:hypothetical protein